MRAAIDPFAFRQLCGHFATGVAIVTALDADEQPAGMTINSFASVSLDPPLVSFAIDHAANVFAEPRIVFKRVRVATNFQDRFT